MQRGLFLESKYRRHPTKSRPQERRQRVICRHRSLSIHPLLRRCAKQLRKDPNIVRSAGGDGVSISESSERFELRKQESEFVQMLKPWFPFIKNWTLIDKSYVTLVMIVVIRGLYFMPVEGLPRNHLPSDFSILSSEQRMLQKVFMAGEGIPANVAALGISPIIIASFLIQMGLSFPIFEYIPSPFRNLINKKRMGVLNVAEVERVSFRMALFFGCFMAWSKSIGVKKFAVQSALFTPTFILELLAALTITRFCCNIIQYHGFGEGTGFLLLAITLSGFGKKLLVVAHSIYLGSIPLWKLGIVVLCYVAFIALCTFFHEIQIRLPLTNYGIEQTRVSISHIPQNIPNDETLSGEYGAQSSISNPFYPLQISENGITALFVASGFSWFLISVLSKWSVMRQALQSVVGQALLFATIAFLLALIPIGVSAKDASEQLSGLEVGIKGVIPGDETLKHLRRKMFHSKLLGSSFLFCIIICSVAVDSLCSIWLGTAIGSLNLVLLVAVISTAFRTMEAEMDKDRVSHVIRKERRVIQFISENSL